MIHIYIHTHIHIYIYMHTYTYIHTYIYIHKYTHIYTHTHTHIYIYICTLSKKHFFFTNILVVLHNLLQCVYTFYCICKLFVKCFIHTHCRRSCKTTEMFVKKKYVFLFNIYSNTSWFWLIILMYI